VNRNRETIMLVPGLGFGGLEMAVLGYRLRRRGFRVVTFFHFPWRGSLADKSTALRQKASRVESSTLHYVAHSMGGLIAVHMLLHEVPHARGRLVLLGSPVNGSVAAQKLARSRWGRRLLGACMMDARNGIASLAFDYETAAIAGNLKMGVGWFLGVGRPCDGVVKVTEAIHVDLRDRRILPVSHAGMLLSRRVADLVQAFLRYGNFSAVKRASARMPR
jgi:pimeloyl-ACP methyl ester carboxylesterase